MRYAARVDGNQPEIVKGLRAFGATVTVTSQLKNAFDILVGYRGSLFIMEIKDGDKPPSQTKLTEGELRAKASYEKVGVKYNVVYDLGQAIDVILKK